MAPTPKAPAPVTAPILSVTWSRTIKNYESDCITELVLQVDDPCGRTLTAAELEELPTDYLEGATHKQSIVYMGEVIALSIIDPAAGGIIEDD